MPKFTIDKVSYKNAFKSVVLSATDTKPARIKCTHIITKQSVTICYDTSLNHIENHLKALSNLTDKHDFSLSDDVAINIASLHDCIMFLI